MATAPYGIAGVANYTPEINEIPNTYGLIQKRGYFKLEGISTTVALIDKVGDSLSILPTVPRGGPATRASGESRSTLALQIPHIPYDDFLTPEDVQDRRAPGDTGPDTIERNRLKKVKKLRLAHAQTREYMRLGAIKGLIKDGNGTTIYNLFTEFGVTQKTTSMDLATATTNVKSKILEIKRYVEENIQNGGVFTGIDVLCSSGFFDKLTNHPDVVEAYQFFAATNGQNPNRNDHRSGFEFQGVTFIEYNGSVKLADGTSEALIDTDTAHVVPVGVEDLFMDYMAPANHIDYVNTDGLEMYLWEIDPGTGRQYILQSESNPLPICRRPKILIKLTA